MLRLLAYLLLSVLLITVLRMVIGMVMRVASSFLSSPKPVRPSGTAGVQTVGELKRDPVCGTYVLTENAVRKNIEGETFYFCSEACRDKYLPG